MDKKKKLIIAAAVLALFLMGGLAFAFLGNDSQNQQADETFHSQLTGEEASREMAARPVLGVMIENSLAARPQTGLDSAGIVFEAATEGGITRYLALYQEDLPEIVGPVRSLRMHFLNWVMGFDASVAHVGGSAQALEAVEKRNAKSLNQFTHPEPYFRSDDRPAPHNMYARIEGLRELQRERGFSKSQFKEIPRKSDDPSSSPTAETVSIDFSSPEYRVEFRYDQASNAYIRYLAGQPHIDNATGQPITVKNVIVVKTDRRAGEVQAIGSGDALVFMDGQVSEVRWEKPSFKERVQLVQENGEELPLNRGDSWFAALPSDRTVTF